VVGGGRELHEQRVSPPFRDETADHRRYEKPDVYDIRRDDVGHLTFGYGLHDCLGANLARLEGRVALDELLNRWPEWDVDHDTIELAPTATVRGWERMPLVIR
jgi:cytochrome P450